MILEEEKYHIFEKIKAFGQQKEEKQEERQKCNK
jgi:hypothetical protein